MESNISWRSRGKRLLMPVLAMVTASAGALGVTASPAAATTTMGYACGYYANVSFFGGPYGSQGCGTQTSSYATANTAAVSSTWTSGVTDVQTDSSGVKSVYGPAVLLSSPYDVNDNTTNTGAMTVSTYETTTTVEATAKAIAVGPSPFYTATPSSFPIPALSPGYVEATCKASGPNAYSGTTRIVNGYVETATAPRFGYGVPTVPVPEFPPENYRVDFEISNIGDHGHMIFNERILNGDGSYTVNGAHMYLEGPTALGDMIIAQVKCGHA